MNAWQHMPPVMLSMPYVIAHHPLISPGSISQILVYSLFLGALSEDSAPQTKDSFEHINKTDQMPWSLTVFQKIGII